MLKLARRVLSALATTVCSTWMSSKNTLESLKSSAVVRAMEVSLASTKSSHTRGCAERTSSSGVCARHRHASVLPCCARQPLRGILGQESGRQVQQDPGPDTHSLESRQGFHSITQERHT